MMHDHLMHGHLMHDLLHNVFMVIMMLHKLVQRVRCHSEHIVYFQLWTNKVF